MPRPVRAVDTPRPAPTPAPTPRPAAGSALERLVASWGQIRRDVKMANSRVAALLSSVDPLDVRGEEVVLVSPYEFHRNKLNDDGIRAVVEDVLVRYMGGPYRVVCLAPEEVRDFVPADPVPTEAAPTPTPPPANGAVPPPASNPLADQDDEQRLRAARSIFNAEEIEQE